MNLTYEHLINIVKDFKPNIGSDENRKIIKENFFHIEKLLYDCNDNDILIPKDIIAKIYTLGKDLLNTDIENSVNEIREKLFKPQKGV